MVRVAWDNRAHPKYALDVLTKGVCDGCALGVAGLHDWTIDGVHLCTTRLRMLEVNTADPIDPIVLSDAAALAARSGSELRRLGRLAHPMRRRRGEAGFRRIDWDEALDALAGSIGRGGGERTALYLTSRGLTNETYYVAGKAARAMGIANVDSAARVCHAPSTLGLKQTIGVAATTCSLQRCHRERPHRHLGCEPGQQPTGVHEVPLPGPPARRPGGGGEPLSRAGARPLLGAVERRVGGVRHEDVRPARAGAPRRRRGLRQRRAEAADRARGRRSHLHRRAHRRVGRDGGGAGEAGRRRALRSGRSRASAGRGVRRRVRLGAARPSCCGRWASPSTATRWRACRPSSTWAWPGATSAATAPGSCPCGVTPVCRAAPRWGRTPRPSRVVSM